MRLRLRVLLTLSVSTSSAAISICMLLEKLPPARDWVRAFSMAASYAALSTWLG